MTFLALAADAEDRAAWLKEAQWGVMSHYLADWKAKELKEPMTVEKWNRMVDRFDVEGLAEQLHSVGAGYYLVTIGQNSGYYLAPNVAYDRLAGIRPSKCSRRDLVADLYEALHKRDIRLLVYLPSGAPAGDAAARQCLPMAQWPSAQRGVPAQMGRGHSRVVHPLGDEGCRLVVRRLLLAQHHVPDRR